MIRLVICYCRCVDIVLFESLLLLSNHSHTRLLPRKVYWCDASRLIFTIPLYKTNFIVDSTMAHHATWHWRRQGGGVRGVGPQRMRKKYQSCLLNLTLNMLYKMTKKYQIVITAFIFFKLKMHQNPFSPGHRWGSLRRSPRPPSWLGRGTPPPHSPPRSTLSASRTLLLGATRRLRRLGSQAPSTQNPGYARATWYG